MRTRNIVMGLIVTVLIIGIASAGILTHYAAMEGKAVDLKQSIVVNGVETNVVQTYEYADGTPQRIYRDSFTVTNRAELPGYITFGTEYSDEGMTTRYLGKVELTSKNPSTWEPTADRKGELIYQLNADEFIFEFKATGLEADTEYALIYYKDNVDEGTRFDPDVWGGEGGAIIATGKSSPAGVLVIDDITLDEFPELGDDLPNIDDWNTGEHYDVNYAKADYGGAPDNYPMRTGAKIWLVPTNTLDDGDLPVIVWVPGRFLFETDLINYDDTNDGSMTLRIGADSTFELIIETEFSMDATPGTYAVTTTVIPEV